MSVVLFAELEQREHGYDRVYCVFDRNGHATYDAAVQRIQQSALGSQGRLIGITSWPCFEVWVLLHFGYVSAPFNQSGNESACDKVLKEVKRHLPHYSKGGRDLFYDIRSHLNDGVRFARQLRNTNSANGSVNPSTNVDVLVSYLTTLKK